MTMIALSGFAFAGRAPRDLLSFATGLGVAGIDHWPWNRGDLPAAAYRRMLDDAGMRVCCVNVPGAEIRVGADVRQDTGPVVRAMDEAVALGSPAIQLYCATPAVRTRAEAVGVLAAVLRPLLAEAASRSLTILIENNLDQRREDAQGVNPSRSVASLAALLRDCDSGRLRICYDPANFLAVGEPAFPEAYERLRPYLGGVHVKDCVRYDEGRHRDEPAARRLLVDGLEGPFLPTVVGEGDVGWPALLDRLAADRYAGWLTLDPFVGEDLLDEWCRASMRALRSFLAASAGGRDA